MMMYKRVAMAVVAAAGLAVVAPAVANAGGNHFSWVGPQTLAACNASVADINNAGTVDEHASACTFSLTNLNRPGDTTPAPGWYFGLSERNI